MVDADDAHPPVRHGEDASDVRVQLGRELVADDDLVGRAEHLPGGEDHPVGLEAVSGSAEDDRSGRPGDV